MIFKFSEASEETKKLFAPRTDRFKAQIKQDNQTMRDKQAQAEAAKNAITYRDDEKDVFE